jgi:hypothetical protein
MTIEEFRERYKTQDRPKQGRSIGLTSSFPGRGHPPLRQKKETSEEDLIGKTPRKPRQTCDDESRMNVIEMESVSQEILRGRLSPGSFVYQKLRIIIKGVRSLYEATVSVTEELKPSLAADVWEDCRKN